MVKLSVISQREVEDTLQDFEKRRYLILSALRAQKNLSTATFFTERERPDREKVRSLRPSGFPSSTIYFYKKWIDKKITNIEF